MSSTSRRKPEIVYNVGIFPRTDQDHFLAVLRNSSVTVSTRQDIMKARVLLYELAALNMLSNGQRKQ
jgi:hypothetical protein